MYGLTGYGAEEINSVCLHTVPGETSQWCSESTTNFESVFQLLQEDYVFPGLNEKEELLLDKNLVQRQLGIHKQVPCLSCFNFSSVK